jgi:hypothetical protein
LSGAKLEIVGGTFVTVNTTLPVSPVDPITATEYAPEATPVVTVNDPVTMPADTVHVELEKRPPGDEEIKHVESAEVNPEPETTTADPGAPEIGDRLTVGPRRTL